MKPILVNDREMIEVLLRRNSFLNIYGVGDLDDFFWPDTTWYACVDGGKIRQTVLLYTGASVPTLLALTEEQSEKMKGFLAVFFRSNGLISTLRRNPMKPVTPATGSNPE